MTAGRSGINFKHVTFKVSLLIDSYGIYREIANVTGLYGW